MKDLENIKLSLNESNQLIITATVDNKEVAFHVPATELLSTGNYDDVEVVNDEIVNIEEPPIIEEPNYEKPELEEPEVEVPEEEPMPKYTVWFKDVLYGKGFSEATDEVIWARPTEHAYDIYVTGPAGSLIYPEIKRLNKLYTTKEELTTRGVRIGFNKIKELPAKLLGEDAKVLIGTSIGPGSSKAKGYECYLNLKNENGVVIKTIHMQYV